MSVTDAYFAGIIDGEGTIAMFPCRVRRGKPSNSLTPVIKVTMTDFDVVRELHATYGGSLHEQRVADGRKPQLRWEVKHRQALTTANRVLPFLRVKRAGAERMIEHYRTARIGRPRKTV